MDSDEMDVDTGPTTRRRSSRQLHQPTRKASKRRDPSVGPSSEDEEESDEQDNAEQLDDSALNTPLENSPSLMDLMHMMETQEPVIPDGVTEYYLARGGFDCPDLRVKRLLALAAQKFVMDIAQDAFQHAKIRQQSMSAKDKKMTGRDKKAVMTVEDLSSALGDYGVTLKRPDYFV